jgi:hypothetical protein
VNIPIRAGRPSDHSRGPPLAWLLLAPVVRSDTENNNTETRQNVKGLWGVPFFTKTVVCRGVVNGQGKDPNKSGPKILPHVACHGRCAAAYRTPSSLPYIHTDIDDTWYIPVWIPV